MSSNPKTSALEAPEATTPPRVVSEDGSFNQPLMRVGSTPVYAASATLPEGGAMHWHYELDGKRLGGGGLEVYTAHPEMLPKAAEEGTERMEQLGQKMFDRKQVLMQEMMNPSKRSTRPKAKSASTRGGSTRSRETAAGRTTRTATGGAKRTTRTAAGAAKRTTRAAATGVKRTAGAAAAGAKRTVGAAATGAKRTAGAAASGAKRTTRAATTSRSTATKTRSAATSTARRRATSATSPRSTSRAKSGTSSRSKPANKR